MSKSIRWNFARNDGGQETGFHHAGVETFKGNFDRYLAREVIQNSLDARNDPTKPVRVEFLLRKLKRTQLPDMDGLKATFARCGEYWASDKKASTFFEKATALSAESEVVALIASDYNTTGVGGSDTDRSKEWYNLIRCAGSSPKGAGEGGSFGIGKNAPFAASLLRTVFYSTKNKDGEHAFQGVATLCSHAHPENGTAQATGFLGGERGSSIRSAAEVPGAFLRTELGTDLVILGFPASDAWEDDLVFSVLDNFWLAIHLGELEVRVGDRLIRKDGLPALLEQFSSKEDFSAHLYYRAVTDSAAQMTKDDLPLLGECLVYLLPGRSEDMPKRVAMIRKSGMKIYEKAFKSVTPFCGVFLCRNDKGNSLLRDMEPPRHDTWDPDHPEKGAHRKTQAEFINFIRAAIKKLAPPDDGKAITVPGLNKYLPDDDETPEESFDGSEPKKAQESFKRQIKAGKIEGRTIKPRKEAQPDHSDPEDDGSETGPATSEAGGEGGAGGGSNETDGGTSGGSGGGDGSGADGSGASAETNSGAGGAASKPALPARYRTFATPSGAYMLRIVPEQVPISGLIRLAVRAVGDDQRAPVEVKGARLADGTDVAVATGGLLGPIPAIVNTTIKLEMVLQNPTRLAMEVAVYEA